MNAAPTAIRGLLLLILPALAHAQHGLMALSLGDPAYEQLAALERGGCVPARVAATRPYDLRSIREALGVAARDPRCTGPLLDALRTRFAITPADTGTSVRVGAAAQLRATGLRNGEFFPLWENVRSESEGTPKAVLVGHLRGSWGDGDKLAAVADGYVESNSRNDPLVRNRQFRGSSKVIDMGEAYLAGRAFGLTLSIGRSREAWLGDGTESMILAANGPPIDRIALAFRGTHWEGHALFGSLDDAVLTHAQDGIDSVFGPQRFYRYLAGHMITWRPSRTLEISAGETAVLSRGSHVIDFYYVNPLVPYIVTQNDTGRTGDDARDNLTAFTSMRLYPGRATLAAELLIDDIQIDAKDRRVTPDQLGFRLSAATPVPIPAPSTVTLTYERIDGYTYMRRFYTEVYQYYNRPLGSQLGPDADYVHLDGDIFANPHLRVAAGLGTWRRGLQRIDERPAQEAKGHAGAPFPTDSAGAPVQHAFMGDALVQWLTPVFPITLRVDAAHITNVDNVPTTAATYARVQLVATYAFRYP